MQFRLGLDDSYMQIRSSILSRETLPDVRRAYATISSDESYRVVVGSIAGSSQRNQASAFVSNVPYSQKFQRSNQNFNVGPSRPNNVNNNRQGIKWLRTNLKLSPFFFLPTVLFIAMGMFVGAGEGGRDEGESWVSGRVGWKVGRVGLWSLAGKMGFQLKVLHPLMQLHYIYRTCLFSLPERLKADNTSCLMLTLEGFPFIIANTKEYHSEHSGNYLKDNA
nr:ribonuclease H-like domain-containing protein [Tanacetum cinerariifolium]